MLQQIQGLGVPNAAEELQKLLVASNMPQNPNQTAGKKKTTTSTSGQPQSSDKVTEAMSILKKASSGESMKPGASNPDMDPFDVLKQDNQHVLSNTRLKDLAIGLGTEHENLSLGDFLTLDNVTAGKIIDPDSIDLNFIGRIAQDRTKERDAGDTGRAFKEAWSKFQTKRVLDTLEADSNRRVAIQNAKRLVGETVGQIPLPTRNRLNAMGILPQLPNPENTFQDNQVVDDPFLSQAIGAARLPGQELGMASDFVPDGDNRLTADLGPAEILGVPDKPQGGLDLDAEVPLQALLLGKQDLDTRLATQQAVIPAGSSEEIEHRKQLASLAETEAKVRKLDSDIENGVEATKSREARAEVLQAQVQLAADRLSDKRDLNSVALLLESAKLVGLEKEQMGELVLDVLSQMHGGTGATVEGRFEAAPWYKKWFDPNTGKFKAKLNSRTPVKKGPDFIDPGLPAGNAPRSSGTPITEEDKERLRRGSAN